MNQTPANDSTGDSAEKVPRRNPILVLTVIGATIAIIALIIAMLFQSPDYFTG